MCVCTESHIYAHKLLLFSHFIPINWNVFYYEQIATIWSSRYTPNTQTHVYRRDVGWSVLLNHGKIVNRMRYSRNMHICRCDFDWYLTIFFCTFCNAVNCVHFCMCLFAIYSLGFHYLLRGDMMLMITHLGQFVHVGKFVFFKLVHSIFFPSFLVEPD